METNKKTGTYSGVERDAPLSTSLSTSLLDDESDAEREKRLQETAVRVVEIRGDRKQKDFADHLGIHVNTLGRYERGEREPSKEFANSLTRKEGINPYWLAFGKGEKYLDIPGGPGEYAQGSFQRQPRAHDSAGDEGRLPLGFVLIPRFDVKAAAGRGAINDSEDLLGHYAYDEGWIRRELKVEPSRICIISVIGDSMDPLIFEGDEVMVDRAVTRFIGDSIYLVRFEGGLLIKQLQRSPGGIIRVVSRNPSYREETVNERAGQFGVDFAILGRVLGKPTFVKF